MELRLDDSIGFHLNRANTQVKKLWIHYLKPHGITPEQWAVLNRLWERDGVIARDLAALVSKDAPNTARILDKLMKKQLIRREPDATDKRIWRIFLTPAGRALREKLMPLAVEGMTVITNGLSAGDQRKLLKLLRRLYDNAGGE
ncbi:MAG: MarR family transcriptional regulator [Gracilibacteraceae bacterium]|jgi:DNA-binding MarR family transcriptional regulator|nr:MarR family transcriptional regulator [Gracilibacteraceae bacterium]